MCLRVEVLMVRMLPLTEGASIITSSLFVISVPNPSPAQLCYRNTATIFNVVMSTVESST